MNRPFRNTCLFGDSIAKGVVFDDLSGKYSLIKNNFAARAADALGFLVNNKARFGCTIGKGREVISKTIAASPAEKTFDHAFLEFGGNDCDFNWREIASDPDAVHLPKTPLPEFIAVYEQVVRDLQACNMTPVILTLPPLVAENYFRWFSKDIPERHNILDWLGGDTDAIYYWHERYNSAVWEVASKTNCPVIDIRKSFLEQKNYKRFICGDGIHLNQEGHDLVYQTLLESARELDAVIA